MLLEHPFRIDSRVLREARSLGGAGYDVTVLALSDTGLPDLEYGDEFTIRRLRVATRRFRGRLARPFRVAETVIRYALTAWRENPDIYHCHSPYLLASAAFAASLRRRPLVFDSHELATELPGIHGVRKWAMRKYERAMLRFVDRVIMSDGESRGQFFRETHKYVGPMDYIYNHPVYVEPQQTHDLHSELELPANSSIVVYTGMIGRGRGLDRAVRSMKNWPENAHLVMIGQHDQHNMENLRDLARQADVADRVHFWGPVPADDVALWSASADVGLVLIQPVSRSYVFSAPTKMFEMIMARVPQVASDFPEIRRVVADNPVGPVGLLIDPTDVVAIAGAVNQLLSSPDEAQSMRASADRLAREHYNWATQEVTLLEMYAQMTKRAGG